MDDIAQLQIPEKDTILALLKEDLKLKVTYQRIWQQLIIEETSRERGLMVTTEEIQQEAERQRRQKRLEKASETLKWLADHMVTEDDWETGIQKHLLSWKLALSLFESEVEKYFAQNQLDFEQLLLYQISFEGKKNAQELFYQIEEEEISFYEAAHLYDLDENRRYCCGFVGKIFRKNLTPDLAAAVFAAPLREVIGPLEIEQKYHLFLVEEFIPAELTDRRRQEIISKLFEEWLDGEVRHRLHAL